MTTIGLPAKRAKKDVDKKFQLSAYIKKARRYNIGNMYCTVHVSM